MRIPEVYRELVIEEKNKESLESELESLYVKSHKSYFHHDNKDKDDINSIRLNTFRIPGKSVASTNITENNENPFFRFEKIKQEIDFIEKDIEFYKKNEEIFQSKFNYSFQDAYDELLKIKKITDFINKSDNLKLIKKITEKNPQILKDKNNISLLNSKIFELENKKLLSNMNLIHEIKDSKITNFEDICYELYLTPDTNHIKLNTQIVEIQKKLDDIKEKIGIYDLVSVYNFFIFLNH